MSPDILSHAILSNPNSMGNSKKRQQKPKKKKEKITYIDDGSTVADMSGLRPKAPRLLNSTHRGKPAPTTRRGQIWQTYKDAARSMVGPMLVFIGGMSVVFFIVWLIFGFFV